jgi:hypothetical protein
MRMTAAGWTALAVTLAAPISANAAHDDITTVAHHRTLRTKHSALRAEVEPPAQVDSPWHTTSHGRFPPTTGHIFTRNAGDCNRLLCIGI